MKKSLSAGFAVVCLLAVTGCFKHREGPHRPVTARSVAEAVAQKEAVERLNLSGSSVGALSQELASMPKLTELWLRDGRDVTSLAVLPALKALRTLFRFRRSSSCIWSETASRRCRPPSAI